MQEVNETPNIESEPATMADATQTAPAVEAMASDAAAEAALPTVAGGKNVILPQHAIGKLKEEQRQRGRREAMTELEAKFKAAGFGSLDDAIAAMAAARNASTAKTAQPAKQAKAPVIEETDEEAQTATTATTQPTQGGDYAKQLQRLQRERERLAKQFAAEQAQRRKLQRTLEAKEAEFALRETAVGKGVKDVDYALRLIQRELEGKDEKALATFSEDKFFDNLRSSHPYLFGETVVPATTGTGVGAAPSAPKASTVQAAQGAAGKLDARNMSADEFQKLMRARGLSALA